jgi:hypothetical protein
VIGYLVMGAAMHYQQLAIRTMLDTQHNMLRDYAEMSGDIQRLRRENNLFPERVEKIEQQMDLVTAAARSGWAQAYRLVRAGVFDE